MFVVAIAASPPGQPAKGPFHHPSPFLNHKSLLVGVPPHDPDHDVQQQRCKITESLIGRIRPQQANPFSAGFLSVNACLADPDAIGDVGGRDVQSPNESLGIHANMAFNARDFFFLRRNLAVQVVRCPAQFGNLRCLPWAFRRVPTSSGVCVAMRR